MYPVVPVSSIGVFLVSSDCVAVYPAVAVDPAVAVYPVVAVYPAVAVYPVVAVYPAVAAYPVASRSKIVCYCAVRSCYFPLWATPQNQRITVPRISIRPQKNRPIPKSLVPRIIPPPL